MAITLDQLVPLLEQIGIKNFDRREAEIVFGVGMGTYKDLAGRDGILLVARLEENGEYFKLFAPMAFTAKKEHEDAFLKACMAIQWRTKLIQFEFDETDGEIRPIIEFPLEDNDMTARQLFRCMSGLCQIVDRFYGVLTRANETGVIDFAQADAAEREELERVLKNIQDRLSELDDKSNGAPTEL